MSRGNNIKIKNQISEIKDTDQKLKIRAVIIKEPG